MLVVDTSVVFKWYVPDEIHADHALALMDRGDLHAPDLLRIEFTNAVIRRMLGNRLGNGGTAYGCVCFNGAEEINPRKSAPSLAVPILEFSL